MKKLIDITKLKKIELGDYFPLWKLTFEKI